MMRYLKACFLAVCLAWLPSIADENSKPNIIVIMCDDLGYGDVGGFGVPPMVGYTPHLDQLAAQGAKLTNYLVPVPYCAPSRASFLTGRYPFRTKLVYNPTPDKNINDYGLNPDEVTIAEALRSGGYRTACVGKWHLGHKPRFLPTSQGFDYYLGILYSNDMRPVQIVENEQVVEYPVIQGNLTKRYTEASIEFIQSSARASTPFFLYLAHAMPHKPIAASEEFYTPETPDDLYADVIRELDWSVGAIMEALQQSGIERETLLIFTSDNGPWFGGDTGGLRGMKARTWEGGIRVPFVARWPGRIPKGVTNNSLASAMDLFPTFLNLARLELPGNRVIDGKSLWPLLQSESEPSQHDFLVTMHNDRLMAVHSGPWKLHVEAPRPPMDVEDLSTWKDPRGPDGLTIIAPFEQHNPGDYPGNLFGDPARPMMLFNTTIEPEEASDLSDQYPDVVKRLAAIADAVLEEIPDLPRPEASRDLLRIPGGRFDFWNVPGWEE